MIKQGKDFVIALGGSIVYADDIDIDFLEKFYQFINREVEQGKRFVVTVGGGKPARSVQKAAGQFGSVSAEQKDWLGIYASRLNANLIRTIFGKKANPEIFDACGKIKDFDSYSLIIAGGWQPGYSTDFVAIQIAIDFGLKKVIDLGKPDYVYDKDNQKFPDAKPFEKLTWTEYSKLVPGDWLAGMHVPVDPVAARLAQKEKIEVVVAGGADLENLKNILEGGEFIGTTIKN